MTRDQVTAIVHKELREAFRTTSSYALATLAYALFVEWFVVRNYAAMMTQPAVLRMTVTISLTYIPLIVIPFYANAIMVRSLVEEKMKQSLMPLLATGVDPAVVWLTKLLTAFCLSYLLSLISVLLNYGMIRLYYGLDVTVSSGALLYLLVALPVVALALQAVMAFLFWTLRQGNIVASMVPVFATMAVWGYVASHPGAYLSGTVVVVAVAFSAMVIVLCTWGIRHVPRRYLVGI